MIIANPIYDTVFKRLMENKRIASFFVETLIGEKIVDIAMVPQEYTYYSKEKQKKRDEDRKDEPEKKDDYVILSIIRFDFVATIRTAEGENKKVLIEIQKSNKATDLVRFRTYLGEQYKLEDTIIVNGVPKEQSLPIVAIYMLGFTLSEIEAIAVKVNRTYIDIIYNNEIKNKDPFIESLTHDAYFIQIPYINRDIYTDWKECSELKQMLSLFEQNYFVDENFFKKYPYPITNKNIKKMIDTLAYIVADPKVKRAMQEEYWAAQNEIIWENQVATLTNKVETLSDENVTLTNTVTNQSSEISKLRRLLQQAGIDIPTA